MPLKPQIFNTFTTPTPSKPTPPSLSTMFRSISTRKHHRGYEQLFDESTGQQSDPKMLRSTTLPANFFGDHPLKIVMEQKPPKVDVIDKQVKKVSKVHPFFSLFERKRKKKATAKPEFSRYLQYLKEGGVWDAGTDKPVIY